ncbi:hypothetical protein RR46_06081 [Papilio xuthus]|uniref:Uncharacterized protein n=1 Tax=Papilio xuthus TaxID=66420 RepID=A0A194Q9W7_PAPXU|nr:hypothetical protein RR46_06081 [Papilio xuthus]
MGNPQGPGGKLRHSLIFLQIQYPSTKVVHDLEENDVTASIDAAWERCGATGTTPISELSQPKPVVTWPAARRLLPAIVFQLASPKFVIQSIGIQFIP